jgi:hypothetical protein
MGDVPLAATVKDAVLPATTVWLAGCVEMEGATAGLFTISIAALLVALPAVLLTATANFALLSAVVSAGVVYVDEIAPLIIAPFLLHWYVMGDVPVAAILNVAVCPAIMLALDGCVEMEGAMAVGGVVTPLPVPLKAMECTVPLACVNLSVPEYASAEDGLKVMEPVRVCPGFKVIGKAGPEYENWRIATVTLEMIMRCRLFSFVKVTVCEVLVNPTVSAPKLMDVGATLTFACATLAKENRIVATAAIVFILNLLLAAMCIRFPSFSNVFAVYDGERISASRKFFQLLFQNYFRPDGRLGHTEWKVRLVNRTKEGQAQDTPVVTGDVRAGKVISLM